VVPDAFAAAMNDDLGTPGALAVLYTTVREGNSAIEAGDREAAAARLAEVSGMLEVLGLSADDPVWRRQGGDDGALVSVVDGLISELLKQREDARARKDYAAADGIRDTLIKLGVEISDTPQGPKWRLPR
jgi:cysteinyl-tRNA synthetase